MGLDKLHRPCQIENELLIDSVLLRNALELSTGCLFVDVYRLGVQSLLSGLPCSIGGFSVKCMALLRARFYVLRLPVLGYTLYDACYNDLEKINGPDNQLHWISLCDLESYQIAYRSWLITSLYAFSSGQLQVD